MGRRDRDVGRGRRQRHERHDVDHAEPRVHPDVLPQVEVLERDLDEASDRRLGHRGFTGCEREHAAVMVGIEVDVDERVPGGGTDRVESGAYPGPRRR